MEFAFLLPECVGVVDVIEVMAQFICQSDMASQIVGPRGLGAKRPAESYKQVPPVVEDFILLSQPIQHLFTFSIISTPLQNSARHFI